MKNDIVKGQCKCCGIGLLVSNGQPMPETCLQCKVCLRLDKQLNCDHTIGFEDCPYEGGQHIKMSWNHKEVDHMEYTYFSFCPDCGKELKRP